ncbi:hypothetical protein ACFWJV_06990 [Streptomyces rochei]|uniref:DUF3040 domain-containing protein n=1 Tax=Streptomyces rochei TaxID=1928 RepID=A0AAX3ZFE9_STRRO|nr:MULTISPECIES: hypothetical protein [Streptomyces]MDI3099661.1 hypothetical protein [Streptomyces sp. AN-3]WDI17307.1 hypothetical protein PS783_06795 [Streptomyces enissocaesilis]WMC85303.1 hypothetical protein P7W03_06850 [Streptomyces rochei]
MVMGTAERREAPGDGGAAGSTARSDADREAPDRDIPAASRAVPKTSVREERRADRLEEAPRAGRREEREEQAVYRPLWTEEPARRRRLPDPVRTAAVRAVLVVAVTLIMAMVAFLCTLAGSWLAFPMVLGSVAGTVVATWGVLDVWVTRQVWNQRHGVVSVPSSTARAVRRERRRARRQARTAQRAQERIQRRGGAGQLSHP